MQKEDSFSVMLYLDSLRLVLESLRKKNTPAGCRGAWFVERRRVAAQHPVLGP